MNSPGEGAIFNKDHYRKRDLFPHGGEKYTLADMITMLQVDAQVRELIPTFDVTKMEDFLIAIPDNGEFRIRGHNNETRFVCEKKREMYIIKMALAVDFAVNDRAGCSHADTTDEQFGRGFMGLGGNSVPRR